MQRASHPHDPVQASAHPHAPITYDNGGQDVYSYAYDANGNQIARVTSSGTYSLTYNVENKLIEVGFAAQQGAAQGIEQQTEVEPTEEILTEPEPTPEAVEENTETEEEQEAPPDGSLNLWERLVAFVNRLYVQLRPSTTYLSVNAPVYRVQYVLQEQDPTATFEPLATETATPEPDATQTETAEPDATRTQEPATDATRTPEPVETVEPAPTEMTEEVIELEPEMAIEMVTSLQSAVYVYDGDGNLVKSVINEVVTYYVGRHYHKTVDGVDVTVKKYYSIGMSQIAVRTDGELNWILTDHLSSASVSASVVRVCCAKFRYQSDISPTRSGNPNTRCAKSFWKTPSGSTS